MLFRKRSDTAAPPPAGLEVSPEADTAAVTGGGRTVIGPQTRIRGTLSGEGPVMVRGTVEGGIAIRGGLTIAASGRVEAEVSARSVDLSGAARGNVRASARVVLLATGVFEGELATPILEVRPGSILRGRTRVAGVPEGDRGRLPH
jgi:cytoskeletal protein CcmA (bactofilin family)